MGVGSTRFEAISNEYKEERDSLARRGIGKSCTAKTLEECKLIQE